MNELKEIVMNKQPVTPDARDKIVNLLCIAVDEDKPVNDYLTKLLDDESGKRLRVAIKAHRKLMGHMKEIKECKRAKVDTKALWIERLKKRDAMFTCYPCRGCKLCAMPKSSDMIKAMTKFPEIVDNAIIFEMDGKRVRITARGVHVNDKKINSWNVHENVGSTINYIKTNFKEFIHT